METEPALHNNTEFISELQDCAKLLAEKLNGDDFEGASKLIHQMVEVRDRNIFQSVGRLTRGLHDAIVNFHVDADLDAEPPTIESSEIQDASDRLNYVITMTQNAADKTMDKVEVAAPIALNLGEEAASLKEEWARLKRREMTAAEFRELYNRIDGFLADMDTGTKELNKNLQDIILEQGFQDLTGQVLKRVIGLISDVERDLVSLVRIAGQVEDITGLTTDADKDPEAKADSDIQGEGPQIHADIRDDVVSGQDDVDDLLSSLGF
ncbi:protein phosphatase CheZ [Maricurvus nonylphenolicus]|uniref:protein phosphatase CheZ n=1 Tax=Maricurvus nonylphenolicus TaxID=1008307 RepID=UPI0036F306EC